MLFCARYTRYPCVISTPCLRTLLAPATDNSSSLRPAAACLPCLCSYVDVRTQTGFTAVHFAVQSSSQQTLAMLLSMDANPLLSSLFDCLDTINCPKGTTALHLAARQGNTAMAKQLLRAYVSCWERGCWPVQVVRLPLRGVLAAGRTRSISDACTV